MTGPTDEPEPDDQPADDGLEDRVMEIRAELARRKEVQELTRRVQVASPPEPPTSPEPPKPTPVEEPSTPNSRGHVPQWHQRPS